MYGKAPTSLGHIETEASELCFVQYMPISFKGWTSVRVPENLSWCNPIIERVVDSLAHKELSESYLYLTAKHLFITPDNVGNRHGWHSDGFMTDDINFVWYDKNPTEFCIQPFEITEDCYVSMREMEEQAVEGNIKTYPNKTLLSMGSSVIHRSPVNVETGLRTFVKVSVSRDKYNLKGNAHNYLFDYEWDMKEREVTRNHPHKES